jgi:oligoribonuclease
MNLLWTDLEMTGLDFEKDQVLEIAIVLTDINLNIIYEKEWVFFHEENVLNNMNDWSKENHFKSGLCEKVLSSKLKYEDCENELLNILKKYTLEKNVYIAGNSVYNDLVFIKKFMPLIYSWLHYRILDISTLKIIANSIYKIEKFQKDKKHRSKSDIYESIEEFLYYKNMIFK